MTDVEVEFVGGPLDGVVSSVRAMTTGQPPGRFAIEVIEGGGHASHNYQVGAGPKDGDRWRYEYTGIRPR
jgi:hypothetical protein